MKSICWSQAIKSTYRWHCLECILLWKTHDTDLFLPSLTLWQLQTNNTVWSFLFGGWYLLSKLFIGLIY